MKTVVLSDHTGDVAAMRERRHDRRHDIEMAGYRREPAELTDAWRRSTRASVGI